MANSSMYLEHYLDSLENLPSELQRNFTLMRDLDQRAQDLLKEIDHLAEEYLKEVQYIAPEKRTEKMEKLQKLFDKTKEYGDDKVQLAIQTYELVDKHIRRLDADLARFEAELKDKATQSHSSDSDTQKKNPSVKGRKIQEKEKKKNKRPLSSDDENSKPAKKKSTKVPIQPEFQFSGVPALPLSITHPSDVLDMPVDPNEPTYCLCHQVSYGEMIGCDNLDCPIEWFHFACVGLTSKPKGKWYCPKCSQERKKK